MKCPLTLCLLLIGLAFGAIGNPALSAQKSWETERCRRLMLPKPLEPQIVVDDVTLDAQSDAPPKWRNIVAETRQKELKAQGEWSEELANEIRASLQDAGFYNAAVTIETQTVTQEVSGMHVAVTAHVATGAVYTVSAVKFEKADSDEAIVFPEETLRSLIPIQDGEIYRRGQIRQGLDQLTSFYGSHGYINFVAGVTTKVDEKNHSVSLAMWLDQGIQYRFRAIDVLGLDTSLEDQLRVNIRSGEVINFELIKRFYDENRSVLPADFLPQDVELHRYETQGLADALFDFRSCSQALANSPN